MEENESEVDIKPLPASILLIWCPGCGEGIVHVLQGESTLAQCGNPDCTHNIDLIPLTRPDLSMGMYVQMMRR